MAHISRRERELRRLGGEQKDLVKRLHQFIRESGMTQPHALELYNIVISFYEYGAKDPELGAQLIRLGKKSYAAEISMLMALEIEKTRCERYFDKFYR
ncbi:MAG: hypothetical protein AABY07_02990 [Nanoarchaeota archaeon]